MIKQYHLEELRNGIFDGKDEKLVFEFYENYEKTLIEDIQHAQQERARIIAEINNVLALCNGQELEQLQEVIYGAIDELQEIIYFGR